MLSDSLQCPWVLLGDFNLIRSPSDRSNDNFDPHAATLFNDAIQRWGVHEIAFTNRRFTWSNHQPSAILVRLDRFFVNNLWCQAYPSSSSVCLTAPVSDHAPILLTASINVPRPVVFRFNNHWIHYHEFNSIVQSAWESVATSQPSLSQSAKLCLCLKRSRADLKAWSKQLRQPDQVLANCNLVVGMMDVLEEQRPLSHAEFTLRTLVRESAARQSTMIAAY